MSKKVRIIEREFNGKKSYTIQQTRRFLWWTWWVDAWLNSWDGAACRDTWPTLKEARENLIYFDGTKPKIRVIPTKEQ